MGSPPELGYYEAGMPCPTCRYVIFNARTPRWVEAWFSGIERCLGETKNPPNGHYRLTQTENPCIWLYVCDNLVVTWQLLPDRSNLTIHEGPSIWFAAEVFEICLTDFINANDCVPPQDIGHQGIGEVFWGPNVDEPPGDPGYEVGDRCPVCNATLFNCFTPKYVRAEVLDIWLCPGGFDPRPVGFFILEQQAPCIWAAVVGPFTLSWELGIATSTFAIDDDHGKRWFYRQLPYCCATSFENSGFFSCFLPNTFGAQGWVHVRWGPGIPGD